MTVAVATRKKPDLTNISLPYVLKRCLLLTAGHWNGADFPASSIAVSAKKLASNKKSTVRLFRGATTDHQDSTGTLIGHTENHEWDGETLWGDCVIIDEDAARVAMYQKETKLKLEGISPRMTTQPPWKPANGKVEKVLEFKSFGIVLDPAQGSQAMLAKDSDGRTLLDDGPFVILENEEEVDESNVDMNKKKEVIELKKLFCEKCELLFDEDAEKCSKCQGELKEADEATVARLQEKTKEEEEKAKKEAEEAAKKKAAEEKAKKEAAEKAAAEAQKQKDKYPEPTYKGRPYCRGPYGYKRPYYGKPEGAFHKEAASIRTHVFSRKPALDQVADLEELTQDFVGFCGAVLKAHMEAKLDLSEAILEITAMLREIPLAAELSKEEVPMDDAVLELVKENEEHREKEMEAELKTIIDDGHKLAPAVREDAEALLSISSDAVLSEEGETVDVADRFRKIIASLPVGATLSLDTKTKRLVSSEAKLSKDGDKTPKEKRDAGKKMAQDAGLGETTKD